MSAAQVTAADVEGSSTGSEVSKTSSGKNVTLTPDSNLAAWESRHHSRDADVCREAQIQPSCSGLPPAQATVARSHSTEASKVPSGRDVAAVAVALPTDVALAAERRHELLGAVEAEALRRAAPVGQSITYDRWYQKYVRQYGAGLYVAYNLYHDESPDSAVTVSEATGYGLLASVLQKNRHHFDGFLCFWRMFLTEHGLMYWQLLRNNGEIHANVGSLHSATDGDMDIALALFLASDVWGDQLYEESALSVCTALIARCYNPTTQLLMLGDWCVEGHPLHEAARPSDFLLSHLKLFAERDRHHATTWAACVEATRQAIEAQLDQHSTGLMADFVMYNHDTARFEPVKGQILERKEDPDYFFNSCRIPWRLSIYYAESGDARVVPVLHALVSFFEAQDVVYAGYSLDGSPLVHYSHLAFVAPVHCLFKVMQSPQLEHIAAEMTAMGEGTYFGDTIQLLCALQMKHLKKEGTTPTMGAPPASAISDPSHN